MNTGYVLLLINQKSAVISIVASFIHYLLTGLVFMFLIKVASTTYIKLIA